MTIRNNRLATFAWWPV